MAQNFRLLATSPTLEGLRQCIANFWCCDARDIAVVDCSVVKGLRLMVGFRAIKVGKRWRFEGEVK